MADLCEAASSSVAQIFLLPEPMSGARCGLCLADAANIIAIYHSDLAKTIE